MAFSIDCGISGYEVRGVTEGTSKKGNRFQLIRLEDQRGYALEVTNTDDSLMASVAALKRGDTVDMFVRAVGGRQRQYIQLLNAPVVTGSAYEVAY